ncbi:MAG: MerR family transcriptional regulator [Synechococcaceae cyanobacterium ELA739]
MVDPVPSVPSFLDPVAAASPVEASYGLDELLAVAGARLGEEISPRTVRLYATQGLIDRPGKDGRSAVYGQRHLLQLLLIRSLARRGLSLTAIAPLCGLDDGELQQQLRQLEGQLPPEGELEEGAKQHEEGHSQGRLEALDYLRNLQASSAPAQSPADDESAERTSSLLSLLGSPLASRSSRRSPSLSPSRSPSRSSGSRDAASRWHRFSLAPGVELQISDAVSIPPAGSRRLAWLQRLTDRLLEQLDERQG